MQDSAPNSADQIRQLADLFSGMAESVARYRDKHFQELAPEERLRLEQMIQQLDDTCDQFTALAIQQTIDAMQADLQRVIEVTKEAEASLKHLNTVAEIASIVSAAAELTTDILGAEYGAIPGDLKKVIDAIPKTSK